MQAYRGAVRLSSRALAFRLPALLSTPAYHIYSGLSAALVLLVRPFYAVIHPFWLVASNILSLLLYPFAVLWSIASVFYPLYVLLLAASICGAVIGVFNGVTSTVILKFVIGFKSGQSNALQKKKVGGGRRKKVTFESQGRRRSL